MAPLKEEVPLIDVKTRGPPDETQSAAPVSPQFRVLDMQDESSYQGETPDVSSAATDMNTNQGAEKDIKTLYDLTGDYWVSLKKDSGEWKQMDGSVWTGSIEFDDPRRSCCLLDSGKYVAQDCSARRRWICVKPLRGDP